MKAAVAAALLLPLFASANEGVAAVSTGGIVFGKTGAIAMKKEVLTVGHGLISVDYEFVNESDVEVDETIVFPLPAYPAGYLPYETYYGQPNGFSIAVDGKPVGFRTVVQALLGKVDVTARLRAIGLSDAQIVDHIAFHSSPKAPPLSTAQLAQLASQKLFGLDQYGETDRLWQVQVNYVWQQKFPSKQVVRVHHAYRPFIASGPGHSYMDRATERSYCADAAFMQSWRKLATPPDRYGSGFLHAAKVSYILKTGNTWKNGIEDFTLNIVKSDPQEIISLCFPGTFRKIDAKTYQVHLTNFRPSADLEVYFGNLDKAEYDSEGQRPLLAK